MPETPIGHAPAPPLSASCARKTIKVTDAQIIQENAWGFVLPCWMERIYGMKAINVNTIAVALSSSLIMRVMRLMLSLKYY